MGRQASTCLHYNPAACSAVVTPATIAAGVFLLAATYVAVKNFVDRLFNSSNRDDEHAPPARPPADTAGTPDDPEDPDAQMSCVEGHHCIPRQILRQLQPEVRREVQRGNIVDMPMRDHRGAGVGIHSQGYNARWQAEAARRGGPRNLTAQDVREIDKVIRREFGLPPR